MVTISTTTPHPSARAAAETRMSEAKILRQLGFWSALLSALFGIGFDAAVIVMYTSLPKTDSATGWTGITSYLETFDSVLLLPLVPSLLLVPAFTVMMVCIRYYAPPEKRLWSHLGLAFALIYAVIAFMNYSTQLLSVQRAILAGETEDWQCWSTGTPTPSSGHWCRATSL